MGFAALASASAGITGIGSALGAVVAGTTELSALSLAAIGAAAGALGSIVSQGVGLATGLQKSFNWGAVAGSAIGGAVSFGLGPTGLLGNLTGNALADIGINAAATNALTQGVELATGLQKKFDWAGVAAAGVGAVVGAEAGSELNGIDFGLGDDLNVVTGNLATGMSRAIANAATRSVINGTDFGDNIMAALPDVVGQTLGNLVVGQVVGWLDSQTQTFTLGDGTEIEYTPSNVLPVPLGEAAAPSMDLTSLPDMTPPTLTLSSDLAIEQGLQKHGELADPDAYTTKRPSYDDLLEDNPQVQKWEADVKSSNASIIQ